MLKVYNAKEVAEILQVPYTTVMLYIRRGELKARKCGKSYKILESNIIEFLNSTESTWI